MSAARLPPAYTDHQHHQGGQPPASREGVEQPHLDVTSPSGVSLLQLAERMHQGMRHGGARIPPPWHVGLSSNNPTSVADLRLLPTVQIERLPDNRITNVVLIHGRFPNSTEMRQKVIADLMTARERARATGPIFTLRWVTMGDALVQIQAEFLETSDAGGVVQQLLSARYDVAFGPASNLKSNPPSTILEVHDYGRLVSRTGETVTAAELTTIFSISSHDLTVVPSFEEHIKFVCFHRGTLLYALLGSPFQSGELQTALWQVGIFYHAAYCHREFVARLTKGPQPQLTGRVDSDDDGDNELAVPDATAAMDGPDLFGLVVSDEGVNLTKANRRRDDDDDFVESGPVSLPPELANLIKPAEPLLYDPDVAGLFPTPQSGFGELNPWVDFGVIPTVLTHRGGVLERPATPDPATPEEDELAAQISAAQGPEEVAEALQRAEVEKMTLTPAGKRRVLDALLMPQSRQLALFEHPVIGNLVLSQKWHHDERVRQALAWLIPDLASSERLSKFTIDLATQAQMVYVVLFAETPPMKILSLLHTPFFSRNLIFLLRTLPTDSVESEAQARDMLTRMVLGSVQKQLFSTISGCRFIEAALQRGKLDRSEIIQTALLRLAVPEFVNCGDTVIPGHLMSQLNGLFAICSAALGADATLDALIVKSVSNLLHRPETRKFLATAVTKVHNDALAPIVQELESVNSATDANPAYASLRSQLIQDFATRGGRIKSVVEVSRPALPPLPSWLTQLATTYPRRAPPFPAVSGSCTVLVSSSHGLYFFKDATGNTSYNHPFTGAEYAATPQAYIWDRLFSVRDVTDMITRCGPTGAKVDRRVIEAWIDDQRIRHEVIDPAVVAALRIGYKDTPPSDAAAVMPPPSSTGTTAPADKKHRVEDKNSPPPQPQQPSPPPSDMTLIPSAIASYPPNGDPFPPLPEGWVAKTSASNGHYYFVQGEVSAYKHPVDGNMYPIAPQAFLLRGAVGLEKFASDFRLDSRRVKQWFADQTARDPRIDAAVLEAFGVTYKDRKEKTGKDAPKPADSAAERKDRKKKDKGAAPAPAAEAGNPPE